VLTPLPELAAELSTTDRTLRRAVNGGLIHGTRVSPRKFKMPLSERVYLRENWPILSQLRETLRTEPSIRAAILFGSYARGEQHGMSDFDILVDFHGDRRSLREVRRRLAERLETPVQLVTLEDAVRAPLLLSEVLRDGRVLVDRSDCWPQLLRSKPQVIRNASRELRRIDSEFSEMPQHAVRA
jgi:predicted nucleotidyltransferase